MKKIIYFILLLIFPLYANAQLEIQVNSANIDIDTLLLGYFYGKNQYVLDTAYKMNDHFVFNKDKETNDGMYFLYAPNHNITNQFIVDKQRNFVITLEPDSTMSFKRSSQNSAFYGYMKHLTEARKMYNNSETTAMDEAQLLQYQQSIDDKVFAYQDELMENYRDSLLGTIIKFNRNIDIPDFAEAGEERQRLQFDYFSQHYFDNIDLKDNRLIYTPSFFQKVKQFLESYTVQQADSLIKATDRILQMTDLEGANYKFLLIDFLNTYGTSEIIGMDAVYVHLVKNYYARGLAPWANEKQLAKIIERADKLEGILIGKQAPELTMELRDGKHSVLYEVDADYTVLFFWTPECGHCKKTIPGLIENYLEFKDKGVKMYAVCTELMDDAEKCWEYIDEHPEMQEFINVTDPFLKSNFKNKYDIFSTPQFFLLDDKKEIVLKSFGGSQLPDILNHFISKKE